MSILIIGLVNSCVLLCNSSVDRVEVRLVISRTKEGSVNSARSISLSVLFPDTSLAFLDRDWFSFEVYPLSLTFMDNPRKV